MKPSLHTLALACCVAITVSRSIVAADSRPTEIHVVHAPASCFVPDVALDDKGVLHMVYALNQKAYYVRSTDNGGTFTVPVQVNSTGTVEFKMGERGPKLAVGRDGTLHVVWVDCWAPGVKTSARYGRSRDGGRSFEPRKTVSSMNGIDGLTVAADGVSKVFAFWHVGQPQQETIPHATWLWLARSADNGDSFASDARVQIANHSGLACSMCMMRARGTSDGVLLAFRSAENNIRDFSVLRQPAGEEHFTAAPMNDDHWELKSCPMCGPELTLGPSGQLVGAFMSRHKVYWSISDDGGANFRLHVPAPANESDAIYPTAVLNRRGEVLLVWQIGPMSTSGRATVHWALYTVDGKFSGRQGTLGTTTSGTKATAFAGRDDDFYVVTTAR